MRIRLFNNYKLKDIQTSDNLKTQFLKYVITSKEQIMNGVGENSSEVIETFENPSSEDTKRI